MLRDLEFAVFKKCTGFTVLLARGGHLTSTANLCVFRAFWINGCKRFNSWAEHCVRGAYGSLIYKETEAQIKLSFSECLTGSIDYSVSQEQSGFCTIKYLK